MIRHDSAGFTGSIFRLAKRKAEAAEVRRADCEINNCFIHFVAFAPQYGEKAMVCRRFA
jgi:hypothetical protein